MKISRFITGSLCCFSLLSAEEDSVVDSIEEKELVDASHVFFMSRSEAIPDKNMGDNSDHYLEGYIQALIDMHFYEHQVVVIVEGETIFLYNLPNNALLANSIISFVEDVPCVCEVKVRCELTEEECERRKNYVMQPCISGVWFPQSTVLFQPLVADPRQVMYSVAYRAGDKVVGKKSICIALGDNFPVYRWNNVFYWCGDLQIGIEAGIWAPFNFEGVTRKDPAKQNRLHAFLVSDRMPLFDTTKFIPSTEDSWEKEDAYTLLYAEAWDFGSLMNKTKANLRIYEKAAFLVDGNNYLRYDLFFKERVYERIPIL